MTGREYLDKLDNLEYAKLLAKEMEHIMAMRENIRTLRDEKYDRLKKYEICARDIYNWLEGELGKRGGGEWEIAK